MKQRWEKLGLIFSPSGEREWMQTHASVPIAENIGGDLFKIYFSSRDSINRSFTAFVVIDINKPNLIIELSASPVISPGGLGEFDDSGAMASWMVQYEKKKYLYYIGWNLGVTVPFRNSIGLAVRNLKSSNYTKYAQGPILDRTMNEPHFCASCCVLPGEDLWRMWYTSCTNWRIRDSLPEHRYHIKYATSRDGILWHREGVVSIDFLNENEYALSRPSVIQDKDCWRMWYSYRGDSYRIGYAESSDGIEWNRLDGEVGLSPSTVGWDSEIVEYPFVFDHNNRRYMLYNGNGYGKTGFGLAVMENL